jgi:hypothetical protein
MKTLEEKKLLVKMARMFGQEVDQALVESIEREEKLAAAFFRKSKAEEPVIPILKEDLLVVADPPPPAPAFTPPIVSNTATQTMNLLNTAAPNLMSTLERAEIEGVKKTLADLMKKIGTLSWGGGGTGIVRVFDADDFDRTSAQNGRYMRWDNGVFSLDEINPFEIIHNTTLVTTPTYVVQDEDYYIGVNRAGPVTIIIPSEPTSGREIAIKDESGNCETHNITISGPIDNDANGAILAINNGALHMLFRGDYWRII